MNKKAHSFSDLGFAIISMAIIVSASNFLVQYPVRFTFMGMNLANYLTWGAFTYPIAFLITDLTNRRFGSKQARVIVLVGFIIAVLLSLYLASPRIALASGSAFLLAHFLDIAVFDKLRHASWWQAPMLSSIFASILDTVLFFTVAFSVSFAWLGSQDAYAIELIALLSIDAPRWLAWAFGDLTVKLLFVLILLAPYRLTIAYFNSGTQSSGAGAA